MDVFEADRILSAPGRDGAWSSLSAADAGTPEMNANSSANESAVRPPNPSEDRSRNPPVLSPKTD